MEKIDIYIPTDEEDRAIREAIASDPDTWEATDEDWANMEWGDPFTFRARLARALKRRSAAFIARFSHLVWSWLGLGSSGKGTSPSPPA